MVVATEDVVNTFAQERGGRRRRMGFGQGSAHRAGCHSAGGLSARDRCAIGYNMGGGHGLGRRHIGRGGAGGWNGGRHGRHHTRHQHPHRRRSAVQAQPQQAPVGRVDLAEQAVEQRCGRFDSARRAQQQHRICAVVACLQRMAGDFEAAAGHGQRCQRQRVDARPSSLDLTPGQLAVGVGVQRRQGHVQVAQRNVPAQRAGLALHGQREVGVAGFVGHGRMRRQRQYPGSKQCPHLKFPTVSDRPCRLARPRHVLGIARRRRLPLGRSGPGSAGRWVRAAN